MSLPARLRSTLTVSLAVALVVLLIPAPAHAGPVDGLCAMNESRGKVPATFAADACVDGSAIWVRNRLRFVVPLRTSGDVLSVTRTSTDYGVAATVTRMIYPDSLVLTPGDTVKVTIGHGAATVGLGLDDGHVIEFHAVASAVEPFIPLPKLAQLGKAGYDILVAFLKDVLEATEDYVACLHTKNWFGQFACVQPYVTAVLQAGERSGIKALAETTKIAAAIVKSFDIIELFESVPGYFEKIGFGEPTIKQAAVGTTASPQLPTSTPSRPGRAGSTAPATGSPGVKLLETIQEGKCLYLVKFLLTNFNPGSKIYVSDTHSYTWCDTGEKGTQKWTVRASGVVQADGSLIWGYQQTVPMLSAHRLHFEDNAGNTATIEVKCFNSVCLVN